MRAHLGLPGVTGIKKKLLRFRLLKVILMNQSFKCNLKRRGINTRNRTETQNEYVYGK